MSINTRVVYDVVNELVSQAREGVRYIGSPERLTQLFPVAMKLFYQYWMWLLYAFILRKLYRVARSILRPPGRRHESRRLARRRPAASCDTHYDDGASDSVDNASSSDMHSYFHSRSSKSGSPRVSKMLMSDDVIVVNRDDRYVEVYERKESKETDVDHKIAKLLREFAKRQ